MCTLTEIDPKLIDDSLSAIMCSLELLEEKFCENLTRNLLTISLGSENVCLVSIKTVLLNVGCRRVETYLKKCLGLILSRSSSSCARC